MTREYDISPGATSDVPRLVELWEASVRATHHFVSEADIQFFKPLVRDGLADIPHLACARDSAGQLRGFIGVAGTKIEMLFIDPAWRGQGIGRQLLSYAITRLAATLVDVNEQNQQALGFYQRMGFVVIGRSARDATGKPYPLLHMRLGSEAEEMG